MKYNLNVLFVLRKAKLDNKGLAPIYLRISVNSKRAELTTSRRIDPSARHRILFTARSFYFNYDL